MRRGDRRSATWGTGRVYRPVVFGREVSIWWLDYSVRGVRIRESSKTRDYDEARRMIPERKTITAQVLQMSGADIDPRGALGGPPPAPTQITDPEILTAKDVSRWLKCSPRHLSRLPIPVISLGHRSRRYFRADVLAWLNQQRAGGSNDSR